MAQSRPQPDRPRPVVMTRADLLEPPEQQTSAIRRRQAFAADDRWVGLVHTEPGEWSGWHHHGETDTYMHVLAGRLEFEYGPDGERVEVAPGEFAHMPHGVVHRERTAPGTPGEIILVRIGRGPAVVNVDAPPKAE